MNADFNRGFMMFYHRLFVVLLLVTYLINIPDVLAADSKYGYNEEYLIAENTNDISARILKWQSILSKIDTSKKKPILKQVKLNLIADYMLQAMNADNSIVSLENAIEESNNILDINNNIWAKIYIVKKSLDLLNNEYVQDKILILLDSIELKIKELSLEKHKDYAYYGIIEVIMRPVPIEEWNEIAIIRSKKLVRYIKSQGHRYKSIRQIAVNVISTESTKDKTTISSKFFHLVNSKEISEDDLITFHKQAIKQDEFALAIDAILYIENQKHRSKALYNFFMETFKDKQFSRARRIADIIINPSNAVKAWSALAKHYYKKGYIKQATTTEDRAKYFANKIKTKKKIKKALELIKKRVEEGKKKEKIKGSERDLQKYLLKSIKDKKIEQALNTIRKIKNVQDRVKAFRFFAENQAKAMDTYNIFKDTDKLEYIYNNPKQLNLKNKIQKTSSFKNDKLKAQDIIVRKSDNTLIGKKIPHFISSNILNYSRNYINKIVPMAGNAEVERVFYENNLYNFKFYLVDGNAAFVKAQGVVAPDIIFIENGITDIPAIYDALREQGVKDYITRENNRYLLRRPLVIGNDATLLISGDSVSELKLSKEKGVYIASVGNIFITDTKITAWSEKNKTPAWAIYDKRKEFRPFLTFWSRSKTYISGTELTALGSSHSKSYGLSMSAGPNSWVKKGNKNKVKERPTGIIADNSFNNMFYGFYSYEADDVSIIGNEYVNNIVYGIDPHDRSMHLNIIYNTVYGTYKKHGIIISREVNNTAIIGNVTFDNKGSGFMVDRKSFGTMIYANTAIGNQQDGITYFESDCAILASNFVFNNKRSGLRIRNGNDIGLFYNIIKQNKHAGIFGYSANLKTNSAHQHRDFELDPHHQVTEISIVGNKIENNLYGLSMNNISGLLLKDNKFKNQSPKILKGDWFKKYPDILFKPKNKEQAILVLSVCSEAKKLKQPTACKFRKGKFFNADMVDYSNKYIAQNICNSDGVVENVK